MYRLSLGSLRLYRNCNGDRVVHSCCAFIPSREAPTQQGMHQIPEDGNVPRSEPNADKHCNFAGSCTYTPPN